MPALCHMPLLRNPDKSKLSKRKNPTSINFYRRMGYLPQGLTNYLGRMGWSMPDESEKFSLEQMIASFDISRVSLGGPVFDVEKLSWLNGLWLRELDDEAFLSTLVDWAFNRDYVMQVLPHLRSRVETLSQVAERGSFCFTGVPLVDASAFDHSKFSHEQMREWLQYLLWALEALRHWNRDAIFAEAQRIATALGLKVKDVLHPVFVAIAGTTASFSVVDSMEIIGSDLSRARLRQAIEILGGVSKKQAKKLEKNWQRIEQGLPLEASDTE